MLKWIVNSLEIFCWEEDYCNAENLDGIDNPTEKVMWHTEVEYTDSDIQIITSYDKYPPDRVVELYAELAEMIFGDMFEDIDEE